MGLEVGRLDGKDLQGHRKHLGMMAIFIILIVVMVVCIYIWNLTELCPENVHLLYQWYFNKAEKNLKLLKK